MTTGLIFSKRIFYFSIIIVLLLCGSLFITCTANKTASGPFTADWGSLAKHNPAPDWFMDAKFGIYFHWGVYSVPAYSTEWYPRLMYILDSKENKYHIATYGQPTEFGYPDFVPMFKAENFNADVWADLFVRAGARFAGLVAEHHDGFSMWDSDLTPWNAADKGPKRDVTGELEKAIHSRGMRFITTFHHARNNLWLKPDNGKENWTGHYEPVKKNYPSLLEDPERAIMYGYMPREQFLDMWKGKLTEVIDKYHPDIMWFDTWLDEIPDSVKTEYLAHYFNRAHEWGKEVVVTFKQEDLPQDVGVLDLEKGRMGELTEFPWLTDDTISKGSWCYTQDLEIKPASIVLHSLIDIVSKNGVLLLNISPKADGTIPANQQQVLLQMGEWLGKYGEAIYDTRPWLTFGEGPTQLQAGEFGGFTDAGGYTAQDVRYTRKGNIIYAILLGKPGAGEQVTLESFAKDKPGGVLNITNVSMPEYEQEITWQLQDNGLVIITPDIELDNLAVVFKIEI
ncbi:alpha-L-fucosidase [candidate division KSB1 bacterium]|nr:alpha-L-fucosidase [candidate division KSB1 bacterium]